MNSAQKSNLNYLDYIDNITKFANDKLIDLQLSYYNFENHLFDVSTSSFEDEFKKYIIKCQGEYRCRIEKLSLENPQFDYSKNIQEIEDTLEQIKSFKVSVEKICLKNYDDLVNLIHSTMFGHDNDPNSNFMKASKDIANQIKPYFDNNNFEIFKITESFGYDMFECYTGLHVVTEYCYLVYFKNYCLLVSYGFDD